VEANKSTLHTLRDGKVIDSRDLSAYGGLNDMAMDRQGRAYIDGSEVTNTSVATMSERRELTGRVLMVPPVGDPRVVADKLFSPNGIAISPDGRRLVVGESLGRDGSPNNVRLMVYDVAEDGSLSGERIYAIIDRGCADGLCFDSEGAVWVGTAYGHAVLRFVDGKLVDRIPVPDRKWPLAVALGGADMQTMFICDAAPPPKGDPSKFTEAWIETVEVDVPGVR
jgi:sugar lactone lactonase YvrE